MGTTVKGGTSFPIQTQGGGSVNSGRGDSTWCSGEGGIMRRREGGDADSAIWTCPRPPVDPSMPSGPNANANTRAHGHGGRRVVAARAYAWAWVWVLVAGHVREGGGARTSWRAA